MIPKARVVAALVVMLATLLWPQDTRAQVLSDSLAIESGRVGKITLGISIDSLYSLVGRERTRFVDLFLEGFFAPALEIRLEPDSGLTLLAHVGASSCGHFVSMIHVHDPRYRTHNRTACGFDPPRGSSAPYGATQRGGGCASTRSITWIGVCALRRRIRRQYKRGRNSD